MNARRSGYTLLELMVALATGSLVIMVAYGLAAASSRQFQEQQKISTLQSSVRVAADQIQRDIERAGYLAVPNSVRAPRCGTPPFEVQAIEFDNDTANGIVDPTSEHGTHADRLRLVGSYATGDQFLVSSVDGSFERIFLQTTWQSFRRNFVDASTMSIDGQALDSVFAQGRLLMLRATTGNVFFSIIESAGTDGAQAWVNIRTALPIGGPCLGGLAGSAVVSVLSRIEYSVVGSGDPAVASLVSLQGNAQTAAAMGQYTSVLLRREISFENGSPLLVNDMRLERVVLENVADFDLGFVVTDTTTAPPTLRRATEAETGTWLATVTGGSSAQPERVRSVLLSLSGRSAEQDPRFPWIARAAGQPLTRYRANGLPGAARVRSVQTEISLPNLR